MPGAKEIRTQINSIGSTRKITKAMEMVAASKMRGVVARFANASPAYSVKSPVNCARRWNILGRMGVGETRRRHSRESGNLSLSQQKQPKT